MLGKTFFFTTKHSPSLVKILLLPCPKSTFFSYLVVKEENEEIVLNKMEFSQKLGEMRKSNGSSKKCLD